MNLEATYLKNSDRAHRKKFAQFFTPVPIAELMVQWLLQKEDINSVLEPAFGLGVFTRVLSQKKADVEITAFEIDEVIYSMAREYFASQRINLNLNLQDFIFNNWNESYDAVICNPPYFKFQDYDNLETIDLIKSKTKHKFHGQSNLYVLFLIKAIEQLNEGGRGAFIIPSEFLNSDYGKYVKAYLIKKKVLRHIFIFDFKEEVFEDAITTASIILFAKDSNTDMVNIQKIQSVKELDILATHIEEYPINPGVKKYGLTDLDPDIKWRNYYSENSSSLYSNTTTLSKYAKVKRGIATGANDYFKFNKTKAIKYQIPADNLPTCICNGKDIQSYFFNYEKLENLIENDANIFLFDGEGGESINNSSVFHYIEKGVQKKIDQKYLTKNRNPWYRLERKPPAPIWVGVFSRKGVKFIRNETLTLNLTTFHAVYPHTDEETEIDFLFSYLITDVAMELFAENSREYGKGLGKYEPNDFNGALMLDIAKLPQKKKEIIMEIFEEFKRTENPNLINQIDLIYREYFLS